MKALLAMTLTAMVATPLAAGAETLDSYRWKKRLLLVTGEATAVNAKLAEARPGLAERDVEVLFTLDPGKDPAGRALGKDAPLAKQLLARTKAKAGAAEVLLLGKDGRTTLRWTAADFTVKELFREIDSMPMRVKEAQEKAAP